MAIQCDTEEKFIYEDDEVLMMHAIYRTNRKRFWKFYRMSWLPGTPLHVGKG